MNTPTSPSISKRLFSLGRIKTLVREMKKTFKARGFKGLLQVYGWKLVAGIFVYYLIRDSILYILIPWLVLKKVIETNPY